MPAIAPPTDAPVPTRVLFSYDYFLKLFQSNEADACCGAPKPLGNLGNICFANAILQCLVYTKPFANYFRMGLYKVQKLNQRGSRQRTIMCEFEELFDAWDNISEAVVVAFPFLGQVQASGKDVRFGRQEDAQVGREGPEGAAVSCNNNLPG